LSEQLTSHLFHRSRKSKIGMNSPSPSHSIAAARAHNSRLGLWLFAIYLVVYFGFVLANAFVPAVMEWQPFGGINLALLYGFGLIVAALLLAFIYGLFAKSGQDSDSDAQQVSR